MAEIKCNAVIGIDPGAGGGIAVYTCDDGLVRTIKMPKSTEDLAEFLAYYTENYRPIAFLEKLNVRRGDTQVPGKIFGIEKMLANFSQLKTTLELSGIPFVLVHPMSWESKLAIRSRGEEKVARKRRYREIAARAYPANKITLWNADAVLIMHFGRYQLANELSWVLQNLPQRERGKLFEGPEEPNFETFMKIQ